jgi:ribosomal protein S18 acetylase RimI-like enzyme
VTTLRVSYMELTEPPASIPTRPGEGRIARENLPLAEYLDLYRRVGETVGWDQRLKMPPSELIELLESQRSRIYVLRDASGLALGFCEFEHCLPEIELKNFGLVPAARGKRLASWLLQTSIQSEWELEPTRIWLHTDNWDHPAAARLYESAGFRVYQVREEPPGDL